ncbi:Auxin response factor 8 [Glycine soja]|nr:hypothetical protein JHK87_000802 [Glycine soja]
MVEEKVGECLCNGLKQIEGEKQKKVKLDYMKLSTSGLGQQGHEGTRGVYFPQGHSEQVAATTNKEIDGHIPNYPSLPPQLICQLHNVTMHADVETNEVYAQMTLQPLTPVSFCSLISSMNFEDIYDVDVFMKSMEGVVRVLRDLPSHVSTHKIAAMKVPNPVTKDYIA